MSNDGNDNIKTYDRYHDNAGTAYIMDKLTYNYTAGTNKLAMCRTRRVDG